MKPSLQLTINGIGVARSIEEILTPETGKILRQAREARGLSVAEAAGRLRLNIHFIESMEAGDLRPLPPGPYRKAFVTEYAKFLNIKLETLQGALAPEEKSENIITSAVSAMPGVAKKMTKSAVKTTESVVKIVEEGVKDAVEEITSQDLWEEADQVRNERLGIKPREVENLSIPIRKKETLPPPEIAIAEKIEEDPELQARELRRSRRLQPQENTPVEKTTTLYQREEEHDIHPGMSRTTKSIVGLLVIIAAIVGYSIFSKKQSMIPPAAAPEEKTAVKQPAPQPKPAVIPKKDSLAVTTPADSLIFTIKANDSVWISVSPDIGNGFRGKLAKGEVRRFSAKDKYFLFLGNQKSVAMTLDGKPVSNLPTIPGSNLVVRNVVLSRDKIYSSPTESKPETPAKIVTPKKASEPPAKKVPALTKNKKATPIPLIKKVIPSVKPVLPR